MSDFRRTLREAKARAAIAASRARRGAEIEEAQRVEREITERERLARDRAKEVQMAFIVRTSEDTDPPEVTQACREEEGRLVHLEVRDDRGLPLDMLAASSSPQYYSRNREAVSRVRGAVENFRRKLLADRDRSEMLAVQEVTARERDRERATEAAEEKARRDLADREWRRKSAALDRAMLGR
jgi:hypothetical protein